MPISSNTDNEMEPLNQLNDVCLFQHWEVVDELLASLQNLSSRLLPSPSQLVVWRMARAKRSLRKPQSRNTTPNDAD